MMFQKYNRIFYNKIYYNFENFVLHWILYRLNNFRFDFIMKFITKSASESILNGVLYCNLLNILRIQKRTDHIELFFSVSIIFYIKPVLSNSLSLKETPPAFKADINALFEPL